MANRSRRLRFTSATAWRTGNPQASVADRPGNPRRESSSEAFEGGHHLNCFRGTSGSLLVRTEEPLSVEVDEVGGVLRYPDFGLPRDVGHVLRERAAVLKGRHEHQTR